MGAAALDKVRGCRFEDEEWAKVTTYLPLNKVGVLDEVVWTLSPEFRGARNRFEWPGMTGIPEAELHEIRVELKQAFYVALYRDLFICKRGPATLLPPPGGAPAAVSGSMGGPAHQ